MHSKVTIKVPDALILDRDASLVINSTTCNWKAGVPITDAAHIARLEGANVPRRRYELIPDRPSPTPPAEDVLEVAA